MHIDGKQQPTLRHDTVESAGAETPTRRAVANHPVALVEIHALEPRRLMAAGDVDLAPVLSGSEPSTVSGTVFIDLDADGVRDANELGSADDCVYHDANNNGLLDSGETVVWTDASGRYVLNNLPPGTHHIRQVLRPTQFPTAPAGGAAHVVVFTGGDRAVRDFGWMWTGWVSGLLFNDLDVDSVRDANEPGAPGLVFADSNNNGAPDPGEPSERADLRGQFWLPLPPGTHTLGVRPDEPFVLTTAATRTVTAIAGGFVRDVQFGVARSTIWGGVFNDLDGDGTRDYSAFSGDEPGIPNRSIWIDINRNALRDSGEPAIQTSSTGAFEFRPSLAPGTYHVRQELAPGWVQTAPANNAPLVFNVTGNTGIIAQSFGARQVATGPTSWKFDLGTTTSPLSAGYTRVADTTAYSSAAGFGWIAGTRVPRDRGTPADPLLRDFVITTDATFEANLINGSYDVTVITGDALYAHDQQAVIVEGVQAATLSTAKNQFVRRTFRVYVTDGRLTLRMRDLGGSDVNTALNVLEIMPAGAATPAEIRVQRGTAAIADGQAPSINFGTIQQGATGPQVVFTVFNDGGSTLTLGSVAVPAGYTLVEPLVPSLAPGVSDTFAVRLDSATTGTKSGSIVFGTNDADESPFNFPITGTVTTPPPPTDPQTPFTGTPFVISATSETTLQAENYDKGGQGVAYHDTDVANTGGVYRTAEGVDLKSTTDSGGGHRISDARAGEWVEYTVDVRAGGTFDLLLRVSNSDPGGRLNVELDGQPWSASITVPDTNSYNTFTTITKAGLGLPAGRHILRLNMEAAAPANGSAGGVNWLRFRPVVQPQPPGPTTTLRAGHDTYARNGSFANVNHGQSGELIVKRGSSDGAIRESFLRFDLSNLAAITSAKLRLFGRISDSRVASLGVTLYSSSNVTWDESTLTWNSGKPAAGPSLGARTIAGTAGKWYEWDVTSFLKAEKAAGRTAVTFLLKANASSSPWMTFNSHEAPSERPELVVA